MTAEKWNNERLDRLADIVNANSRDIIALKESIAETNHNVNQLVSVIRQQQQSNTEVFQAIVQEIRGLRTEQRRILNHLFGEQESES